MCFIVAYVNFTCCLLILLCIPWPGKIVHIFVKEERRECDKLDWICQVGLTGAWYFLMPDSSGAHFLNACVCVWCPRSCMSGDSLTASFVVICISCKAEILGLSNSVYCGMTEWWYIFLSRYFAYFGVLNACQHVCSGCCQARYWGDGLMPPDVAALKWACYAANLHVIYNYW